MTETPSLPPPTPREQALAVRLGEDSVRVRDALLDGRTPMTTVHLRTQAPRAEWTALGQAAVDAVTPTVPEGTELIDLYVYSREDAQDAWFATAKPGGPLAYGKEP